MSAASSRWQNPRLVGRIPELDGLRGIAILLVLLWHYVHNSSEVTPGTWASYLRATLGLSWSGVDLFFVLSGFLIGGILYDARQSGKYYQTYYARRVYRIFPLYFIWIGLFIIGLALVGTKGPTPMREIFNRDLPVWSYPLFLQNFMVSSRETFGPAWMSSTWSLAVEEQFYLLLPFLVRNLNDRGIKRLAIGAIVCAPLVRLALSLSGNTFFGPYALLPARADALGLGVLAALACRSEAAWAWLASHRRHLFAAFLILGCGVALLLKYPAGLYTVGITWIAAFYTSVLLLAVVNPGRLEMGVFRSLPLMKLGLVAYAVYIFHQGVHTLFHFAVFGSKPNVTDWRSAMVTLLSLITALILAALSWRYFEKPLIRYAHTAYRYEPTQQFGNASACAD